MIKAVVFDCDGLLIDTETPWYDAFCDIFEQYGATLPLETYVQCVGSDFNAFNPYDYLEQCIGKKVDRPHLDTVIKDKHAQIMENTPLRPGVRTYLQTAKELGLGIGLASSSNRKWVQRHITEHDIANYFDAIQTSDDVHHVKPDPQLYSQAVEQLGVAPEEAIAFEDSANGLAAAKAAGLHCVIVPNPTTALLPFKNYDDKIESMEEKSLPEMIQTIESRQTTK